MECSVGAFVPKNKVSRIASGGYGKADGGIEDAGQRGKSCVQRLLFIRKGEQWRGTGSL